MMTPVHQKACPQFHRRNCPGTHQRFYGKGNRKAADFSQQQEADPARSEHTYMAAPSPEQFHSNICTAANSKKSYILQYFQTFSPH